jgi:hypothetical protein
VAQGQLGKSTEQKRGDIGLGEEIEMRPVAGCLGGDDEAGKESWSEVESGEPFLNRGTQNFLPRGTAIRRTR